MAIATTELYTAVEIAAIRTDFNSLRNKSFTITPDCVLKIINRELSGTSRAIYLYLYGQAEKKYNRDGKSSPVVVSAKVLAEKHIFKSIRTIKRRLAELETKGFVIIQRRINAVTLYNDSNAIWPVIPAALRQELLQAPNRRAPGKNETASTEVTLGGVGHSFGEQKNYTLPRVTFDNSKPTSNRQELTALSPDASSDNVEQAHDKADALELLEGSSGERAYVYYTKLTYKLQGDGMGRAKAYMRAFNLLNKKQQDELLEYTKVKARKEQMETFVRAENLSTPSDKNGNHKIYNIIVNNNSSAVSSNSEVKENFKTLETNVVKIKNKTKKLTSQFIAEEIIKLYSKRLIPEVVFRQGKTVNDLIAEIEHHVINRSLEKTSSDLHALNSAKAMLLAGTWATPKKFVWARTKESLLREQLWEQQKQQERRQNKTFINNLFGQGMML